MTEIKVTFNGQQATAVATGPIPAGTVGMKALFSFDDKWDGLGITAVFRAGNVTRDVADVRTEAVVPWEVLEKHGYMLEVGVTGMDAEEVVIPTVWAKVDRIVPGSTPSEAAAQEPTPDVYQQLLALEQQAVNTANSVREDADNGKFNGKSAYEAAVEGGYTGTELKFNRNLARACETAESFTGNAKDISPGDVYAAHRSGKRIIISAQFDDCIMCFSSVYVDETDGKLWAAAMSGNKVYRISGDIAAGTEGAWELTTLDVSSICDPSKPHSSVSIDIPNATGVEPYYVALNEDRTGLVTTQDAEQSMDVYAEIVDGGFYIYTITEEGKIYFNINTDIEPPSLSLQTEPVTAYKFLQDKFANTWPCHISGDYGYALSVKLYDGDFSTVWPSQYGKYTVDFISKDANKVVLEPEADTPYRLGVLYGYPEAYIKLIGDVRDSGVYGLDVSNTASGEPVIISGVATPERDTDAANKKYVDKAIAAASIGGGTATPGLPGEPGKDGKSAYEYAVEGGYTGSEEEFAKKMALNFVTKTQAEYDALEAPDPNTYYFIKDDE